MVWCATAVWNIYSNTNSHKSLNFLSVFQGLYIAPLQTFTANSSSKNAE